MVIKMFTVQELLFIVGGYLSGSVLYSYLLPKYLKKTDITQVSDDGNPGTANVFKCVGIPMGILVLCLELLKGFLPVHLALRTVAFSRNAFALILAAPVLGHAYPFWNLKKGGKSIAVSFGALLGLIPVWTPVLVLAAFYLSFSLIIIIQPHFFRSVITYLLFTGGVLCTVPIPSVVFGCAMISLIVIRKHFVRYQGEKLKIKIPGPVRQ